jgi:hypothetical protein
MDAMLNSPADAVAFVKEAVAEAAPVPVDLTVLRLHRRPPPALPIEVFGDRWARWISDAAAASACPVDYVVAPLLASISVLIGNARWAQANEGWSEPPHLWMCSVGDSGGGKSPGADPLMRRVLPVIENKMMGDFPERLREHQAAAETAKARKESWEKEVRTAAKMGNAPPLPPQDIDPIEPQMPRLRLNDATIEKVAAILATAAPKGVLMVRDEIAGFLLGMNSYNDGARAFWIESYGGRPYRVERMKYAQPIDIHYLAVGWFGGTQPDRLAQLMREGDDGLLARFCWFWPDATPFNLTRRTPNAAWAVDALERLRILEMGPSQGTPAPVPVPLVEPALRLMVEFGQQMQDRQQNAGGLMRSAYGKARGLALRLALNLEYLWWAAEDGMAPPPATISELAFLSAAQLVDDYLMPMAERVYGDAAAKKVDRDAATLARWIRQHRPEEVHVRTMQREVRLPGLGDAESIHSACGALVEAGWLAKAPRANGNDRQRAAYPVSALLWAELS